MKNIIIFLHGKGANPTDLKYKPLNEIASRLNADLVPITAPIPHKDGFRWNNGNKQSPEEALAEFTKSMAHIEAETTKILTDRKQDWSDIIWLGHSQGGDMAMRMALTHGAKRVIVFASDISSNFPLPSPVNKGFQVDWIESGQDTVLDENRRSSYKTLQQMGVSVNHIISQNSTHDNLDLQPYLKSLNHNSQPSVVSPQVARAHSTRD